jgi:hypothetical protein
LAIVTLGFAKNVHHPVVLISFSGRQDETNNPNVGIVQKTTKSQTTTLPNGVLIDATTLVPTGIRFTLAPRVGSVLLATDISVRYFGRVL